MVNCAYCGKRALVPSDETDPMETLLADTLEESRQQIQEEERATPWGKGLAAAPLRIAWTAVFVVLVASVLLLTVRWVWREVTKEGEPGPGLFPAVGEQGGAKEPPPGEETASRTRVDQERRSEERLAPRADSALAFLERDKGGVVVFSIPPGLDVYVEEWPSRDDQPLRSEYYEGNTRAQRGLAIELLPGDYLVSVVADTLNTDLWEYPGYNDELLRPLVETEDADAASRVAEDLFLQDDGEEWRVERLGADFKIVRTYVVEDLRDRDWRPIYALFVPDVDCAELVRYASPKEAFVYDQAQARRYLRMCGIPQEEIPAVFKALSRIGKAVVKEPEKGKAWVFRVWPNETVRGKRITIEQMVPGM
jgi:hypothetical protein